MFACVTVLFSLLLMINLISRLFRFLAVWLLLFGGLLGVCVFCGFPIDDVGFV